MANKNDNDVDDFISGGSSESSGKEKSSRGRPKKENTLTTYTTRMDDEFLEKLRAFAHYKRVSQREVLEKALEEFFDGREKELKEALKLWEQDNDTPI